jgi:hypothetical protein
LFREPEVLTMSRIVRPFACLIAVTGALALLPNAARAQFFPGLPEFVLPKLSQKPDIPVSKLPPLGKTSVEESVRYVFEWEKRDPAEMRENAIAPLPWTNVEAETYTILSLNSTTADQGSGPLWERRYQDGLLPIATSPRKIERASENHLPLVSWSFGPFH